MFFLLTSLAFEWHLTFLITKCKAYSYNKNCEHCANRNLIHVLSSYTVRNTIEFLSLRGIIPILTM